MPFEMSERERGGASRTKAMMVGKKESTESISELLEASALKRPLKRSVWSFSRKLRGQGVIQG